MLMLIVGIVLLLVLWSALKNLGQAIGYAIGLVLSIALLAVVGNVLWNLLLWALPYLAIGAGVLLVVVLGVYVVQRIR